MIQMSIINYSKLIASRNRDAISSSSSSHVQRGRKDVPSLPGLHQYEQPSSKECDHLFHRCEPGCMHCARPKVASATPNHQKHRPPFTTKPVGGHLQEVPQRPSPPESSPLCHYARDRHRLCVGLGSPRVGGCGSGPGTCSILGSE